MIISYLISFPIGKKQLVRRHVALGRLDLRCEKSYSCIKISWYLLKKCLEICGVAAD
ncbi:hypothetical protein MIMGU_mgv11b014727mg [Erythranthe guttata]|uniref:Uncharacterized protein n=1 Tax=Erythranthe guttata TaxID=4155 RepID=A0A022QAW5_ERYGU|nr:hypothetical protein MIMGU_mgv11b014727mg [Erythranthe guttata]